MDYEAGDVLSIGELAGSSYRLTISNLNTVPFIRIDVVCLWFQLGER